MYIKRNAQHNKYSHSKYANISDFLYFFFLNSAREALGGMDWKQEISKQQPVGKFFEDCGCHLNKQCCGSEQNHGERAHGGEVSDYISICSI